MGYNKIILEGHLTRDIEIKYTAAGAAIGNTAIATSRKFKTAAGEQKEEVLFVDIAFFGRTAEIANQFLRKGSHVLIDGRLKLDQWTDQTTQAKRSKHSVTVESMQMLDKKETQPGQPQAAPAPQYGQPAAQPTYGQPAGQPAAAAPAYGQPAPAQPRPQQSAYNHPGQPAAAPTQQAAPGQPAPAAYAPNGAPIVISEDEIPF